jgi:predicted  nucleic acid-binding Zn-ribbon protein
MAPTTARTDQRPGSLAARQTARQLRDDPPDLSSEMQTLGSVIKDLEAQLDRVMTLNEALKQDLESERRRRVSLEGRVAELEAELTAAQREIVGKENLAAEAAQLHQERTELLASVRELNRQLAEAHHRASSNACVAAGPTRWKKSRASSHSSSAPCRWWRRPKRS